MSFVDDALALTLPEARSTLSLEEMLTSPEWFSLETATQLQRLLCRAATGQPANDVAIDASGYAADIAERMGWSWCAGGLPWVDRVPLEVYLLAGIRCGKSLLAAVVAVYASQTIGTSALRPGERCRFSVVSLDLDKARAVIMHLHSAAQQSARIKALVVGELRADGLDLRHPSGTIVEVRVSAGKRAGGGLVAYWSAGVVFDEAPRMVGEADGVVNFEDSRKAVLGRLLPGAQLWAIGSPWAPMGPIYKTVSECWGKAGSTLVVRAPAAALNPTQWTPEACEELREHAPEVFRTDVLGEWGTPETAMFSEVELGAVMRAGELGPVPGETYVAVMDPAGRGGNAWTLVIGTLAADGKLRVMLAKQWFPSATFTEAAVLRAMAPIFTKYAVNYAYTDQYASGFVQSLAQEVGIYLTDIRAKPWTSVNKLDAYDSLRVMIREKRIELCDAEHLRDDLLRVRRKLTQNGATIETPGTADGRHCDYAPALAMLAATPMNEAKADVKETPAEREQRIEREDIDKAFRREIKRVPPVRRRTA